MFRAHDKAMLEVVWSKHSAQLRLISYFTSEETSYIFLPLHPIIYENEVKGIVLWKANIYYLTLSIPTKVKLKPDYLLFQFTQCQSALKHLCYRITEYIGQRDSKSAYLFTLPPKQNQLLQCHYWTCFYQLFMRTGIQFLCFTIITFRKCFPVSNQTSSLPFVNSLLPYSAAVLLYYICLFLPCCPILWTEQFSVSFTLSGYLLRPWGLLLLFCGFYLGGAQLSCHGHNS